MKEQVRTEIARILEEWFNDPIDVPCAYCEAAKEIEQQLKQHEAQALKEQMERVIKKIYKSYSYLRCLCLAAEDGSEKAKGYDLAMNEALSELVNLKAELEGENG